MELTAEEQAKIAFSIFGSGGVTIMRQLKELTEAIAKAQLAKDRPVCPDCDGEGAGKPDFDGYEDATIEPTTCSTCKGTGRVDRPDREKILDTLKALIAWNFPETLGKGQRQLDWNEAVAEIQALFSDYTQGVKDEREKMVSLIQRTLRDFSDIHRETGHPKSYWAGYHYARGLMMAALKETHRREAQDESI